MAALEGAFAAAQAGEVTVARSLLAAARGTELRAWFVEHAQNVGRFRAMAYPVQPVPGGTRLDPVISYRRLEAEVMGRDGYHCRYCGSAVVHGSAFGTFEALVGREYFRARGANAERHGLRLVMSAALDHVVPHSRGGRTDADNLVTCCWPCNYGKFRYTLGELGLDDPRRRPPVSTTWTGLRGRVSTSAISVAGERESSEAEQEPGATFGTRKFG